MRVEGSKLGAFNVSCQVETLDTNTGGNNNNRVVQSTSPLELRGSVVSQSLELVLPDLSRVLESIHFGTIYFKQERSFTAVLVNNGPHPSSFSTVIESKTEDEELLVNFVEMTVEPSQGTLEPMSQCELLFKFSPIEIDPQFQSLVAKTLAAGGGRGSSSNSSSTSNSLKSFFAPVREFIRTALIGVIETGQTIEVQLTARVCMLEKKGGGERRRRKERVKGRRELLCHHG